MTEQKEGVCLVTTLNNISEIAKEKRTPLCEALEKAVKEKLGKS